MYNLFVMCIFAGMLSMVLCVLKASSREYAPSLSMKKFGVADPQHTDTIEALAQIFYADMQVLPGSLRSDVFAYQFELSLKHIRQPAVAGCAMQLSSKVPTTAVVLDAEMKTLMQPTVLTKSELLFGTNSSSHLYTSSATKAKGFLKDLPIREFLEKLPEDAKKRCVLVFSEHYVMLLLAAKDGGTKMKTVYPIFADFASAL